MRLIDTHAHLEELPDLEQALAEARAVGVTDVIAMSVDAITGRQVVEWAESRPGVWAAVGHHPLNQQGPDLELLRELASRPRVVAIGEIGLDHEDEYRGPHEAQLEWFHACCRLAVEQGLPVSVHVRGSAPHVYEALRHHAGITGVMHYWTLGWEWARRFLDLGMYLSFSGVLTRAGRQEVREVARKVPAHRLLLETDAPWGTPRGRRGPMRPAWMVDTAAALAEIRGLELAELAELERANAQRLFRRLGG